MNEETPISICNTKRMKLISKSYTEKLTKEEQQELLNLTKELEDLLRPGDLAKRRVIRDSFKKWLFGKE